MLETAPNELNARRSLGAKWLLVPLLRLAQHRAALGCWALVMRGLKALHADAMASWSARSGRVRGQSAGAGGIWEGGPFGKGGGLPKARQNLSWKVTK
jgi:hypothetical protein